MNTIVLHKNDCIEFIRNDKDEELCHAKILGFTFSGNSPPREILYTPYRIKEGRWSTPICHQRKIMDYDLDSIKLIPSIPGETGYLRFC
jgi:hypothetical protein